MRCVHFTSALLSVAHVHGKRHFSPSSSAKNGKHEEDFARDETNLNNDKITVLEINIVVNDRAYKVKIIDFVGHLV